jgi:hypothetical protein
MIHGVRAAGAREETALICLDSMLAGGRGDMI